MASNPVTKLTEEQYLAIERSAEFKSEFLNGVMFAMSSVSIRHAQLQGNVYGELFVRLCDGACRAFSSDLRVKVSKTGMYLIKVVQVG